MSWIKIRKDNTELVIPEESFKCLFEWQGFVRVDERKPTQTKTPRVTEKKRVVATEQVKRENGNGTRKGDTDKPNQD